MESSNSRLRDRAEKLRSQLDTLKKEINVANAFLQEVLDVNLKVVEELESVMVSQIYLREYTKVQKFLLKHINFVTEVNCNLEILTGEETPMLNNVPGPQYSVEYSQPCEDDQVFHFSADKKVSNLEYSVNQDKVSTLTNADEKTEVSKKLIFENKIMDRQKEETLKSDAVLSPKKNVLDPETWTEAPVFVPKQASGVKVPDDKDVNIKVAPKSSSPALPAVSKPVPTVSASPLYTPPPVQPQNNSYQYTVFYPRFGFQAAPPGISPPPLMSVQSLPVNIPVTWPSPYPPKPPLAVTRNPIKIEAPPKENKIKIEAPETKRQPVKIEPEIKIVPRKTDENEFSKTEIESKEVPEVVANESKEEEVQIGKVETSVEKTENGIKSKGDPVAILNEKKSANVLADDIEVSSESIPEMKISRESGTKYPVVFGHMVSPGEFYVQILCPELSLMREMTKELEGYFKSEKVPPREYQSKTLKNIEKKNMAKKQIGRHGLCYTVDDPSWARIEITDWRLEKDDDTISVFFIDYGDTKDISLSHVQPMISKFRKYPKFAQRCHLAEIYPADSNSDESEIKWNEQAVTMFEILLESMSHDFSCQIIVCKHDGCYDENSLPVRFFVSEDGNCLNDKLVEFEYAVESRKSDSSSQPEKSERELVGALNAAASEPFLPGEVISIQVTCLLRLNKFYCTKEYNDNEEDELQKLERFMNKPENVKDMLILTEPPAANDFVIGKFDGDNLWYRAKVVKSDPSSDRYKLLFLDYGNTQVVNLENIRKMERKFLSFPFQLITCYLSGIELIDDGKSESAMKYFYKRVEEGDLSIKIISCKSEVANTYEVILYDKEGQDVGADIVSKNFAKKT